ncbi:hypothetical protein R3P38DRAFT_3231685 [Favolaschia claudopus]|uniref:Uncharacterized protein n=1 Tax=Favolaschia claudopus TaxID=2862362 RepID=A0AAV9ZGL2_9AGAR
MLALLKSPTPTSTLLLFKSIILARASGALLGSMYLPTTASPPPPPPSQPRSHPVLAPFVIKTSLLCSKLHTEGRIKGVQLWECARLAVRGSAKAAGTWVIVHRPPHPSRPTFTLGDPSELARPPPMFPTATPPTTLKAMNEEWAHRYNATHEQRELRKLAEEQRRQQQFQYEREVRICCWMEDGDKFNAIIKCRANEHRLNR